MLRCPLEDNGNPLIKIMKKSKLMYSIGRTILPILRMCPTFSPWQKTSNYCQSQRDQTGSQYFKDAE